MAAHKIIDDIRHEIRGAHFEKISEENLQHLEARYELARHSKELLGFKSFYELEIFYKIILEERVPEPLAGDFLRQFLARIAQQRALGNLEQ